MRQTIFLVLGAALVAMIGCVQQSTKVDGAKYLLKSEPEKIKEVIQARKETKDGEEVVIVGRIGGSKNPWIKDRAAFTIVDNSLTPCTDPEESCPTPWDYCCELDKLPTSTAFIKVVDENGSVVKADAREFLPLKELSTVVVPGLAKRDDAGNLTVLANKIFVKKK